MKLTVDCVSTGEVFALPQSGGLAHLLSKASIRYVDLPLEALVCEQHCLPAAPDYPIAAIAATEDGLDVGDAYWLRADPVHLLLQRDSFSLSEPFPLSVSQAHAHAIIECFNAHFTQDGLKFSLGASGAWYVSLTQFPQIKTVLPSLAMGKNVGHFMPQGVATSHWLAYLNEVQMLLHAHEANIEREQAGEVAINSVWFSGGGVLPVPLTTKSSIDIDCLVGNSAFYKGLAKHSGLMYQAMSQSLQATMSQIGEHTHVRVQLTPDLLLAEGTFNTLLRELKTKNIKQLVINLACYDRTLVATINPIDLYKFWRKTKSMRVYLA